MTVATSLALLPWEQAAQMTEVFGALSDPTRLRILYALSRSQHTTSELAAAFGLSDSAISHQLRTLRQLHLVASRREGKLVWHRLADAHARSLIAQGLDHASEGR